MGYACPVCEDPQADAGHLANHLAFTALLGDEDHESWLDEHAPEWGEMGEADLADVVVEEVEETEFPQVFEDTVGGLESSTPDSLEERSGALFEAEGHGGTDEQAHDHAHGHGHDHGRGRSTASPDRGPADADTEAILEEAREMTREMLGEADADGDGGEEQDGDTETNADADAGTNADADADENG